MDISNLTTEQKEILSKLFSNGSIEKDIRTKRNNLLRTKVDTLNPIRWETLSEEEKEAWRTYRQQLLDVPQQNDFPNNVQWPVPPS